MSIVDKLPKPPTGYKWKVSLTGTWEDLKTWVRLQHDSKQGVPWSKITTYAVVEAEESAVIEAAKEILPHAYRELHESTAERAKAEILKTKYAHLLTD